MQCAKLSDVPKWTKGRDHTFPFRTRYAWVWEDRRIFTSGGPGAVVVGDGLAMDLQTGEVYRDSRFLAESPR